MTDSYSSQPGVVSESSLRAMIAAVEANERALLLGCEGSPGVAVRRIAGATLVDSGVPIPFFNGVAATDAAPEDIPRIAAEAAAWFGQRGMPWVWRAGPPNRPADLPHHLRALGFTRDDEVGPAMWADLTAPLADRTVDVLVAPADDVATWYDVFAAGFELPPPAFGPLRRLSEDAARGPLGNLLAWEDGVPVGTASLVIAGGVAGLYNIAVRHECRGRGLGRDITIAAMAAGRDAGCATAVLTATPLGLPVYRRLGFHDAGRRALYEPPSERVP